MAIKRNQDGVVVSWLMKLALFTAVAAFILLNAGAIVTNMFSLSDKADEIAISLSTTMAGHTLSTYQLQQEGEQMASKSGAKLVKIWVDDQNVLHVKLKRAANVALIDRVKALKKFIVAKETGSSSIS
jgi:hypothetical protein